MISGDSPGLLLFPAALILFVGFCLVVIIIISIKEIFRDYSTEKGWHKHEWEYEGNSKGETISKVCLRCGEIWQRQRMPSLWEKGGIGVEHGDIWWKVTGKNSLRGVK